MKTHLPVLIITLILIASAALAADAVEARGYTTQSTSRDTMFSDLKNRFSRSGHYSRTRTEFVAAKPTTKVETTITTTVKTTAGGSQERVTETKETTTEEPVSSVVTVEAEAVAVESKPVVDTREVTTAVETESATEVVEQPVASEPADSYLEAVQKEIHRLTNVERARAGVATLQFDEELAQVAQAHSQDMIDRDYFAHTSPDGCNAGCRLIKSQYAYWSWGENIAWRRSSQLPSATALAATFMENWMNSSGHRRNILSENFTHEGVGLAQTGNTVYVTTTFANPR